MEHRPLGATGLTVSSLGLGLAALGRPGYITLGHGHDLAGRTDPPSLERHTHQMLDAALAGGITYFDAARSYGRAEEFLARWLDTRNPEGVTVGSKWGYVYKADWQVSAPIHEVKIHTRDNLDKQYEESLGLLGDRLMLYQIHSASLDSGVLDDQSVLERLARIKRSGMVVGLSTSGTDQSRTIQRSLDIEVDGVPLFGVVEATWNLLEPSAEGALQEASEAGMGVIVKEAVANGRLTPRDPSLARQLTVGDERFGVDAIAIAAALRRPWASVVLSGAAIPEHLAANIGALDVPDEVIEALPSVAETPEDYWATRSRLPWG